MFVSIGLCQRTPSGPNVEAAHVDLGEIHWAFPDRMSFKVQAVHDDEANRSSKEMALKHESRRTWKKPTLSDPRQQQWSV
jgi:hypothetical protein